MGFDRYNLRTIVITSFLILETALSAEEQAKLVT